METDEHDGRNEGLPLGGVALTAHTGPPGVQTAPTPAPQQMPPQTQAPQVVVGSPTSHVTPAADTPTPAPSHVSVDATLEIPPYINDLSQISQEQAMTLVTIYNTQVKKMQERKHTAIYHQTQLRLRAEREALHPEAERRAYVPTQRIYDSFLEESEVATVETCERLQLARVCAVRSVGVSADIGNGTLRDIQRGTASNQRKRRREGAARRIAEASRSTGSGNDQRQLQQAQDLPPPNQRDDRRQQVGSNNIQVEVTNKKRRVNKCGPPPTSSSLSSTVMEAAPASTAARSPHGLAPPPPPPGRQPRDISPIRGPATTTTTSSNQRGTLAVVGANQLLPPSLPVGDDQTPRVEKNANKKRNRRPRKKDRDASTSNRSSTSAASSFSSSQRIPLTPEDLLTPEMLAVAIRMPGHPRREEIQRVVDVLPADFYPNLSPMDRAVFAADHAVDSARQGKKLAEQYNFRMKVIGEKEKQAAEIAKWLSDAHREADRLRAGADPFAQHDGQRPSTSGTQRHASSSRGAASTPSGQRPPSRSGERGGEPSYRGRKGGRGKGRK